MAFSVIRVPFFLEPNYDESKKYIESNRDRLVAKWGGKRGWEAQKRRHDLKGRGMEAGIPHFNLDRLAANSMASHRLIQHIGKTYGLQVSEAVYDRLNQYYFVDGNSLNDRPLLASVVREELSGLLPEGDAPTEKYLLDFLNSDEGREEIENALVALDRIGVHSIPKFIIDGRMIVDGAAHSDTFVEIFREIESSGKTMGEPVFKDILKIPDEVVSKGSHVPKSFAA